VSGQASVKTCRHRLTPPCTALQVARNGTAGQQRGRRRRSGARKSAGQHGLEVFETVTAAACAGIKFWKSRIRND